MAHTSNDLLRDNEEPSTLCRILENGVMEPQPTLQCFSDMFWTWLNLVGWSVNEGLISGGSPSLCNYFFPNLNDLDAYKAIDKGRKHVVDAFVKIEPLLAKYLK